MPTASRKGRQLIWLRLLKTIFLLCFCSSTLSPALALDFPLNAGWNMVSLPKKPLNTDIKEVTSSIEVNLDSVWAYLSDHWAAYYPNDPASSELLKMQAGTGYWIRMKQADALSMAGYAPAPVIQLQAGLNLVGYNSVLSLPVADAMASIAGKYTAVWAFIDNSWRAYYPDDPGFSDLEFMEPGVSYWIDVTEDCSWAQPPNHPPVANAGETFTARTNQSVPVSGLGSY